MKKLGLSIAVVLALAIFVNTSPVYAEANAYVGEQKSVGFLERIKLFFTFGDKNDNTGKQVDSTPEASFFVEEPVQEQPVTEVMEIEMVDSQTELISFDGSHAIFYATSKGLTEIRVYYLPASGNTEEPVLFGSMELSSTDSSDVQHWVLSAYPQKTNLSDMLGQPILASKIYAVGYIDVEPIYSLDYPFTGASSIYGHLY